MLSLHWTANSQEVLTDSLDSLYHGDDNFCHCRITVFDHGVHCSGPPLNTPFAYLRDPLFLVCFIAYWIHSGLVAHGTSTPLFRNHLNDLICVPFWVPIMLCLSIKESVSGLVLDTIKFHTFHSIVIALGGENQVPADPPDANHGTFQIAIDLYHQGYDVWMFDEDEVDATGAGAVYDEVARAVAGRLVTEVAVFGYSHGGGSTFLLCRNLNNNRANIGGNFSISPPQLRFSQIPSMYT